jgi:hypothetical protein
MTNALSLDWAKDITPRIAQSEFPAGVLEHMDANVLLALSDLRTTVGKPLMPSPVFGAHVRHSSSGSRHATRDGRRLSDATDFFIAWEDAHAYMEAAEAHPNINGIGIYTDMLFRNGPEGTWAMMHIDCRPANLKADWVAWRESRFHKLVYVSKQRNLAEYNRILNTRGKLSVSI